MCCEATGCGCLTHNTRRPHDADVDISSCRDISLGFTPTAVEPAPLSSNTHSTRQDFAAQRLTHGPDVHSVLGESWHCSTALVRPWPAFSCDRFHSCHAPICPGRGWLPAEGWEGRAHHSATQERTTVIFPLPGPTYFITMERCCSLKYRWGWKAQVCSPPSHGPWALSPWDLYRPDSFLCDIDHFLPLLISVFMQVLSLLFETGNTTH